MALYWHPMRGLRLIQTEVEPACSYIERQVNYFFLVTQCMQFSNGNSCNMTLEYTGLDCSAERDKCN